MFSQSVQTTYVLSMLNSLQTCILGWNICTRNNFEKCYKSTPCLSQTAQKPVFNVSQINGSNDVDNTSISVENKSIDSSTVKKLLKY